MTACVALLTAASLACIVLAVIALAMWLSPEFVNNLAAVLNVLASQVATALDTLNFALAVDRNSESDPRRLPGRHVIQDTDSAHASSRSASLLIGLALPLAPGLGPWTLLRPGICLNFHLLEKHVVKFQPSEPFDHNSKSHAAHDHVFKLPRPWTIYKATARETLSIQSYTAIRFYTAMTLIAMRWPSKSTTSSASKLATVNLFLKDMMRSQGYWTVWSGMR